MTQTYCLPVHTCPVRTYLFTGRSCQIKMRHRLSLSLFYNRVLDCTSPIYKSFYWDHCHVYYLTTLLTNSVPLVKTYENTFRSPFTSGRTFVTGLLTCSHYSPATTVVPHIFHLLGPSPSSWVRGSTERTIYPRLLESLTPMSSYYLSALLPCVVFVKRLWL